MISRIRVKSKIFALSWGGGGGGTSSPVQLAIDSSFRNNKVSSQDYYSPYIWLGMALDMGHSSKYPTLSVAMHNPNDEYNGR